MNNNLITKDEDIKTSYLYMGYLILKTMDDKNKEKISIFEIVYVFRREFKIIHYRQILLSLIFLYTAEIIDFKDPYIYKKI